MTLRDFPSAADEYAYFISAELFAEGRLSAPSPRPRYHFNFTHIINDGRFYGKYPPGWPALLSQGFHVGAPWIVNPLVGTGILLMIFVLASENFGRNAAWTALLTTALSPYFIFNSASYFSHPSCAFFTLLFLLFYLRSCDRPPRRREYWWMGLAAGAMTTIRPSTAVFVLLPLGLWFLYRSASARALARNLRFLPWGVAPTLALCALHLSYNRALTGEALLPPVLTYDPEHTLTFTGWLADPAGRLVTHVFLRLWDLAQWLPVGLTALLLVSRPRGGHRAGLLLTVFGALLLGHVPYDPTGGYQYGPRYLFEALGPVAILGALGLARLGGARKWGLTLVMALDVLAFVHFTRVTGAKVEERIDVYEVARRAGLNHAVVFLRTGSGDLPPANLTRNGTSFDGPALFVLDLGRLNRMVLDVFPERRMYFYVFDEETRRGRLIPWGRTRQEEEPRQPRR